ncbi:MAG: hypothetical protein PHX39_03155, partial [Bacteroidales bacterium]|nr:hypothetical protein [Bacteroidales bacterium]
TEFMTGMDTRIGYPNEHLTNNTPEEMSSPMYATGIGLVIEGLERVEMKMRREEKAMVGTNMEKKSKAAEAKPKRQGSFLKKIQDFFENDTE